MNKPALIAQLDHMSDQAHEARRDILGSIQAVHGPEAMEAVSVCADFFANQYATAKLLQVLAPPGLGDLIEDRMREQCQTVVSHVLIALKRSDSETEQLAIMLREINSRFVKPSKDANKLAGDALRGGSDE